MSSENSAPLPDVIDVDAIELDMTESDTKIKARTNEASQNAKSDSETETEDELESKSKKRARDDNEEEGTNKKGATEGDRSIDQAGGKPFGDQEKARNTTKSTEGTGENSGEKRKRIRIKLEEIKNFDILLPNERNGSSVRQAKKDFYAGFVSYLKLVDRLRPVFMEHQLLERNTTEHKKKIGRWLVGKITERGGRFLKEDGDGTSGNCKVMTSKEALNYTIHAFEENIAWTSIASDVAGGEEKCPYSTVYDDQEVNRMAQSHGIPAELLPVNAASSEQASLANTTNPASAEPHLNKESGPTAAALPPASSSSTLHAKSDPNQIQKRTNNEVREPPHELQKSLRERQVIFTELTENQEVLLVRQERLSHLEAEFRMFQERQMFLPSERWLAEKILRQEEIFENRELLGIQHQRCRRLQTLLDLNERQIFEQQKVIERETIKLDSSRNLSNQGATIENGKVITIEDNATPDSEPGKAKAIESIDKNRETISNQMVEAHIRRQQQSAAKRAIDHHIAIEAEIKRRAALEQRTALEQALEKRAAMEQELKYRQAMDHAMKRQAAMQQSMEARQIMMSRRDPPQRPLPEIVLNPAPQPIQVSKRGDSVSNASPDVAKSIGGTAKESEQEAIIVIGDDHDDLATQEGGNNGGDAQPAQQGEQEDDDDDFSIVI